MVGAACSGRAISAILAAMQENAARHPLVVPVIGAAFALAAIALLIFALMGWATQGAEMFRALSAAGLSWCM